MDFAVTEILILLEYFFYSLHSSIACDKLLGINLKERQLSVRTNRCDIEWVIR